jgi:hypothetical protein
MRYAHDGTKVSQFPLVEPYPTDLAHRLDTLARELAECLPAAVLAASAEGGTGEADRAGGEAAPPVRSNGMEDP